MNFIPSNAVLLAALQAIIDTVLEVTGPTHTEVHLATGSFNPVPGSVPGDFTEADYTGYAAIDIAGWTDPELDPGPAAKTLGTTLVQFRPTGTTVTNVCTGFWLVGGDGTYLGGQAFDSPIPMGATTDAITIIGQWMEGQGTWSMNVLT